MHEQLHEFCDSRGAALRVDRTAGVIRGIKILGLESRNQRRYLPDALARAITLYEGAKVNVNHPKGPPQGPRDYQDRIGVVRNVALRPDEGLFGDFHFNPKHALAEQLLWDAEHSPENVGFSHNVSAKTKQDGERVLVEEILRVQSVDLVADPATTRGLFEAVPEASTSSPPSSPSAEHVETLLQEQAAVIADLQAEVERLRKVESQHVRERLIRRLLAEHHLPSLESVASNDTTRAAERTILSERFIFLLENADDETEVRRLIEDRAPLVNALKIGLPKPSPSTPISRDQFTSEPLHLAVHDVHEFVRSIRG